MTGHTPKPWLTVFDKSAMDINPVDFANEEYLAKINGIPPARIVACVNACAGVPTEDLGDVKALVEASSAALQYILLAHKDALNSQSENLVKIAKRDFEALVDALAPFRKD